MNGGQFAISAMRHKFTTAEAALIPLHFGIGQAWDRFVGGVHKLSFWGPVGASDVVENLKKNSED